MRNWACGLVAFGLLAASAAAANEAYDAAFNTGKAKFKARDYKACREAMTQALGAAKSVKEKAEARTHIGRTYYHEKEYKAAREAFAGILQIQGVTSGISETALTWIARCHSAEKNYAAAREAYGKILKLEGLKPGSRAQTRYLIGQTYYDEKKFDLARKEYQAIVSSADAPVRARVAAQQQLARSYWKERKYGKGGEEYDKVLAMPGATPNRKAEALFMRARCCAGDYAARRQTLARILELKGVHVSYRVTAQYRIGRCYFGEKKYAEAKAAFNNVLKMKPLSASTEKAVQSYLARIEKALAK